MATLLFSDHTCNSLISSELESFDCNLIFLIYGYSFIESWKLYRNWFELDKSFHFAQVDKVNMLPKGADSREIWLVDKSFVPGKTIRSSCTFFSWTSYT